jgi:hypothetical protein
MTQSVDLVELNHKYGPNGSHTFSQVIFWERVPENGKYRVRDWVLVETQETLNRIPILQNGVYETCFIRDGIYYHVRSNLFRESWTMHDPEALDAMKWPKDQRRPLSRPGVKIPDDDQP